MFNEGAWKLQCHVCWRKMSKELKAQDLLVMVIDDSTEEEEKKSALAMLSGQRNAMFANIKGR